MELDVLIFGPLASEMAARRLRVTVPAPATVEHVRVALAERYPLQAALFRGARLAVNHALAAPESPVGVGDEIAVIEMVSGG